jgi:REP element-mobilizing transposase RayT
MPQSLSRVLIHVVFSTKNREDLIPIEVDADLHAYLGGIGRNVGCPAIAVGGTANHVNLLVNLARTVTIADLLLNVKRDSSKWMKTKGVDAFAWQDGYGAISIGESAVDDVCRYIANQWAHHEKMTFQDEVRALCRKYGVELDERYAWE